MMAVFFFVLTRKTCYSLLGLKVRETLVVGKDIYFLCVLFFLFFFIFFYFIVCFYIPTTVSFLPSLPKYRVYYKLLKRWCWSGNVSAYLTLGRYYLSMYILLQYPVWVQDHLGLFN